MSDDILYLYFISPSLCAIALNFIEDIKPGDKTKKTQTEELMCEWIGQEYWVGEEWNEREGKMVRRVLEEGDNEIDDDDSEEEEMVDEEIEDRDKTRVWENVMYGWILPNGFTLHFKNS
jgi:hypothetical protein